MSTKCTSAVTLSRDEAVALSVEMFWTNGDSAVEDDLSRRDVVAEAIRRLPLESAIRDAMGWWRAEGGDPVVLNIQSIAGEGECPESWQVPADVADLIAQLLPAMIERVAKFAECEAAKATLDDHPIEAIEAERKRLLEAIAARVGGVTATA